MNKLAKRRSPGLGRRMLTRLRKFARDLQAGKDIAELYTCRRLTLSLPANAHNTQTVKAIRRMLKASQPLFARFLGVSPRTVQAWEQGEGIPNGIAGRFLDEIRRNPDYWRKRFQESIVSKT